MKVYIVLVSGYYNDVYYDACTEVDSVFSTYEKARSYIESKTGIFFDEKLSCWSACNPDDTYSVRMYEIMEKIVYE